MTVNQELVFTNLFTFHNVEVNKIVLEKGKIYDDPEIVRFDNSTFYLIQGKINILSRDEMLSTASNVTLNSGNITEVKLTEHKNVMIKSLEDSIFIQILWNGKSERVLPINQIQGKQWGKTTKIFDNINIEIHKMDCLKDGYCSEHKHKHKYNMFHVVDGELKITEFLDKYDDITYIKDGESCQVSPEIYHKFEVVKDTIALEIYWTELSASDIERRSSGGMVESKEKVNSLKQCKCEKTFEENNNYLKLDKDERLYNMKS